VIFTYMPLPTKAPVPSLGGAMLRYCPIVPVLRGARREVFITPNSLFPGVHTIQRAPSP
jgi:hypothetical protein